MSLLAVRELSKSFGGVRAVDRVGFSVAAGEIVAMIGPNGAGKSTCFNMLSGQLAPDAGSIELAGKNLAGKAPRDICRLGVGRTFQITATFGSLTVRENLQVALLSHARKLGEVFSSFAGVFSEQANALLNSVGMESQADKECAALAYGDLKRVELAIALASQPRLLLMDEPTAGMASAERHLLMNLVESTSKEKGISVLFTEHDVDVVFRHAERVIVLSEGRLVAQGDPAEVRADPLVHRVYLGEQA
ncbi:MAG TPA: ABC transporter ATP-binding protein [Burkholderiales bacterium]|jgi:branched-chain amino acid transport system ATP-binding protein